MRAEQKAIEAADKAENERIEAEVAAAKEVIQREEIERRI